MISSQSSKAICYLAAATGRRAVLTKRCPARHPNLLCPLYQSRQTCARTARPPSPRGGRRPDEGSAGFHKSFPIHSRPTLERLCCTRTHEDLMGADTRQVGYRPGRILLGRPWRGSTFCVATFSEYRKRNAMIKKPAINPMPPSIASLGISVSHITLVFLFRPVGLECCGISLVSSVLCSFGLSTFSSARRALANSFSGFSRRTISRLCRLRSRSSMTAANHNPMQLAPTYHTVGLQSFIIPLPPPRPPKPGRFHVFPLVDRGLIAYNACCS